MCGIAGWIDWDRDLTTERRNVQAMIDTMACRGPDAEGLWLSARAAIGHRRLAVIDVEGGAQPMIADRRAGSELVLSFSGELYNFVELRRELQQLGHSFRTRSDTEVVLQAFARWGEGAVERFNGMYAFAIWDAKGEHLTLVRDRLGVKPLYYAPLPTGVLFGSEPKAILANPMFRPAIDREGLAELFALPAAKTPGHAIFRGLHEVKPAHTMRVTSSGIRERRYWQLTSQPHHADETATAATVRSLLGAAVSRQLVSDVPLGCLLSGGLDSSAITALAARTLSEHNGGPISTFDLDFAGSQDNFIPDAWRPSLDAPYVELVVEAVGAHHTHIVLDGSDLLVHADATLAARDLPSLHSFDVSLYLLCREVRRQATVALSGESADELFGGYPWYNDADALDAPTFPWLATQPAPSLVLNEQTRNALHLDEYVADRYAEALAEVPRLDGETGHARRMREVFYLSITRFLPIMLDRKDRMSMAVGLEVRVPYCDHELVEYVWNIPWETKSAGGQEKGILRRAIADLLPPEVVNRRKSGFPIARDPGHFAEVSQHMRAMLADPVSPLRDLLDTSLLSAVLEMPAGSFSGDLMVAGFSYLLGVDAWLRRYHVAIV